MKVVLQVLDELILTNPVFTNLLEEVLSMAEELEINDSSSAYTQDMNTPILVFPCGKALM